MAHISPSHPPTNDAALAGPPVISAPTPSAWWRTLSAPAQAKKLPKDLDAAWDAVVGRLIPLVPRTGRYLQRADCVLALEPSLQDCSDEQLNAKAIDLRDRFRLERETPTDFDLAFAVIRETARRQISLHAHHEQVAAAMAMSQGALVEVATGEGKTLVATMPAIIAGWRGRGCHLITVNDYLAQRDAEWMSKIYSACGLQVAYVNAEMDPVARQKAYAADITYVTNKEVTADFLRDRLQMGSRRGFAASLLGRLTGQGVAGPHSLVLRGLETAIVDEADSVLIDEAVTPLIISGDAPNAEQTEAFIEAAQLATQLEPQRDFTVNAKYREVNLRHQGRQRLAELCAQRGGIWTGARRREELVVQALTARQLFHEGQHYVVEDGKVAIVDEFTGRKTPDRTWRDGLHQAIEAKEGLEINPPKITLARISFQRFFRQYRHLCGMTGTAWESRHEMWQIYRLRTVRIPTHRPCIRSYQRPNIFTTAEAKWHAVANKIRTVHENGQPVLVGTRSVEASEQLSAMLDEMGLEHRVLNAVRHAEEAKIIAGAGEAGSITVATNMAGRGTDIQLGHGVAAKGGLLVIATEMHTAGRIDRQLYGRSARQGDPGEVAALVSLEDELSKKYRRPFLHWLARMFMDQNGQISGPLSLSTFRQAQARAQRLAYRQRKMVLRTDDWLDESLGFAGRE